MDSTVTPETPVFHYEQRQRENDLVALEVFDPARHAAQFVDQILKHPEVFAYTSFPPVGSADGFLTQVYNPLASSLDDCLYAIRNKIGPGRNNADSRLAGVLSFNYTSKSEAVTELGVVVFPAFPRTHIAANAIGLALVFALDPPSQGGLGLRRVAWQANARNEPSRRIALRMGFEFEGVQRWQRTFAPDRACQEGNGESAAALAARNGTRPSDEAQGRHTAVYSVVWDEWDAKRPEVLAQMVLRKSCQMGP
ncbi:hypothetical protein SCUCBS95973_009488 [Sporothrix curviconia]|uniref:N-acetyltransferase domain-containing protein n=1 Tax=Sporothrix curviconia TaxID=1260050 RepID=A0ABP0CYJ0_9PEZI